VKNVKNLKKLYIKYMIIHISGASGSGKSYLGRKLKDHFGHKIIVKDIDHLRDHYHL